MIQTWLQACEQQAIFFQHVMLMVVENLVITQHRKTLQYANIQRGGY
jgi:hypothetical protein